MKDKSDCPINFALEIFGDRWTLLIIRDLLFEKKRYYREFLKSEEGIATNTLADRLVMLEKEGIITKQPDRTHKQKIVYSLTEKGIDMVPIIIEMGYWSLKHYPVRAADKEHVLELKRGGEKLIKEISDKLKSDHNIS